MYRVIIPREVSLHIKKEFEFWEKKDQHFANRMVLNIQYHIERTLRQKPGFGAISTKIPGYFYYPIVDRFKLVFSIYEAEKKVILQDFFNNKRKRSEKY